MNEGQTQSIHLFAGFLHSHLAGRAMRVRHVRNGKELPPILKDDSYDFNFQDYAMLSKQVEIKQVKRVWLFSCALSWQRSAHDMTPRRSPEVWFLGSLHNFDQLDVSRQFFFSPQNNATKCLLVSSFVVFWTQDKLPSVAEMWWADVSFCSYVSLFSPQGDHLIVECDYETMGRETITRVSPSLCVVKIFLLCSQVFWLSGSKNRACTSDYQTKTTFREA